MMQSELMRLLCTLYTCIRWMLYIYLCTTQGCTKTSLKHWQDS